MNKFKLDNLFIHNQINIKQVVSVILSFINIVFSILPFFIITEYMEMFINNSTWRLEYREIWSDILFMIIGIAMFVYSLITIIKYFRHIEVKLLYPALFLILYFVIIFLPF